jgi:hypothetical protein
MNKLVLALLFIISLSACSNRIKTTSVNIMNGDIVNSVSFQPGSYFVYVDSLTNVKDSMWVYEFNNHPSRVESNNEYFDLQRLNYYLRTNSVYQRGQVITQALYPDEGKYIISGNIGLSSHASYYWTDYSQSPILYSSEIGEYAQFITLHDSLKIRGKYWPNVFQVYNISFYGTENDKDTEQITTYYSLQNGLLKYTQQTKDTFHVWEIESNKIIH